MMNRREFITLLGGAAAWPIATRAQQPAMPVIGWLSTGSRETDDVFRLPRFRQGLNDLGWLDYSSSCRHLYVATTLSSSWSGASAASRSRSSRRRAEPTIIT
jgi:hypothetical protein